MKKNNLFIFGMLVILLTFSFSGCGNDSTTITGEYVGEWWSFSDSAYEVIDWLETNNINYTLLLSPAAAWTSGADAAKIYNRCKSRTNYSLDHGIVGGSFEELVDYSAPGGVPAPNNLKEAMLANKAKVPLTGIFDAGSYGVVFYIREN